MRADFQLLKCILMSLVLPTQPMNHWLSRFIEWYRADLFYYLKIFIDQCHKKLNSWKLSFKNLKWTHDIKVKLWGESLIADLLVSSKEIIWKACPVNAWLGKLTALDMTSLGWLGRKTYTQTNDAHRTKRAPYTTGEQRRSRSVCATVLSDLSILCSLTNTTVSIDSVRGQCRPWSACAYAQADLGLRCPQIPLRVLFVLCAPNKNSNLA